MEAARAAPLWIVGRLNSGVGGPWRRRDEWRTGVELEPDRRKHRGVSRQIEERTGSVGVPGGEYDRPAIRTPGQFARERFRVLERLAFALRSRQDDSLFVHGEGKACPV